MTLLFNERESYLHARRSELRTKEDDFIRTKKDLEKQIAQLRKEIKVESGSSSTTKDPVTVELKRLRVSLFFLSSVSDNYSNFLSRWLYARLAMKHIVQPSLQNACTVRLSYRSNFSLVLKVFSLAFCKSCVDARLATRQRKCPACNLPFGHSDVHTFFFQ